MHVTMLTSSVSRRAGGLFFSVRRLAESVQAVSGVGEVEVLGLRDHDTAEDLDAWRELKPRVGSVLGPAAFGYCPEWPGILSRGRAEVVHVHGLWMYPSVACTQWSKRTDGRYVISPRGMLDAWALRNSGWKKKAAGWLYENRHLRGASCLHALNRSEAAAARDYGLTTPICVIPNGVSLPDEAATPIGDEKICVFLGRLHPKKGLPSFLRAWARASTKGWRLDIAGWDQLGHERELRDLSRSLRLADSVRFLGPKFGTEKAELLRSASAFVLPSLSEGLPMAVLEAWSYGLPVLMTPQCNLPEGFDAGAAISMEASEEGAEEGIRQLTRMCDVDIQEMGARGRRLVEQRFTWSRIADEMVRVYAWVLGRGPRPECVVNY